MVEKKVYTVTEKWYSSHSGEIYTKVNFMFFSIEKAKEYIKKEMDNDLEWYIKEYMGDDEEWGNKVRKETRRVENEEDNIYGIYPEDGERKWFEYQIDEVRFWN